MKSKLDLCAACCLLWSVLAAQPPDTVWTRRFDIRGWEDNALEVVADTAGNVFVFIQSTDTSYYNQFSIVKYRTDGTLLLTRNTHHEPVCDWDGGIAIDPEGKVIIAYPSSDDYVVSKYAPDAGTLWTRRFDTGESDYPYDVACDRSGNIIVTGRSYNANGDWDYLTVKYSPAGDTLWTRRYDSGNSDWARSVATDSANGIIICGVGESAEYGYLKYDSLGSLQWGHPWPGLDVYGVAIEPAGGVLLAGTDSSFGLRLMRADPEGNTRWTADIPSADGYGTSVCPDNDGILVTGITDGDMYLARFDTLGHEKWSLSRADTVAERNSAMCLNAAGDLIVAVTSGWGASSNYVTIIKYATTQGLTGSRSDIIGSAASQTIVRGVLRMPEAPSRKPQAASVLLDIGGRKALDLHPGPNDVSGLAPGVYFVHSALGVKRGGSSVAKVVITR